MEYIMSCSNEPTFHHDLPFISLHYTYVPFKSSPQDFTASGVRYSSVYNVNLIATEQ
jgi:hypothetical protein